MGIAHYIRRIGRGRDGATSLGADEARDLMSQLLDGRLSDLEIGAFALAMRVKGESLDELSGFFDALHAHCIVVPLTRPAVLLPSYNGARKLPNLTPLLAALLARAGVPVLVHGTGEEPARVTSAELFRRLDLPLARDARDVERAWAQQQPAYLAIDALCPPLGRLLDVRRVVGVRNSGHTLAKLVDPLAGAPSLRVVGYTHRDYAELLAAFVLRRRANAMLLRGTEGEPCVDARRAPRFEVFVGGEPSEALSARAAESAIDASALPCAADAASTTAYLRAVLAGEMPPPAAIAQQVAALRAALARIAPR